MLCDGLVARYVALSVAETQRLDEMCVLRGAIRTGDAMRIVAIEIEPLLRMQEQFEAIIALQEYGREIDNILFEVRHVKARKGYQKGCFHIILI